MLLSDSEKRDSVGCFENAILFVLPVVTGWIVGETMLTNQYPVANVQTKSGVQGGSSGSLVHEVWKGCRDQEPKQGRSKEQTPCCRRYMPCLSDQGI